MMVESEISGWESTGRVSSPLFASSSYPGTTSYSFIDHEDTLSNNKGRVCRRLNNTFGFVLAFALLGGASYDIYVLSASPFRTAPTPFILYGTFVRYIAQSEAALVCQLWSLPGSFLRSCSCLREFDLAPRDWAIGFPVIPSPSCVWCSNETETVREERCLDMHMGVVWLAVRRGWSRNRL